MKKSSEDYRDILVLVVIMVLLFGGIITALVLKNKVDNNLVTKTGIELQVVDKNIDKTTVLTNKSVVILRSYILTVALDNDNTYDVECTSSAYDDVEIGEYRLFTVKLDGQSIHEIHLE